MKGLTDIPGIRVGHATDFEALTGCTAILCESGAVAGVDIRGGASGTEEIEVMSPLHVAPVIHAVVLAGGSAFGLEAASGVRRFLEQKGVGFDMKVAKVPIVPAAILFDLAIGKANVRPSREMGEAAARAATDGPVVEGNVGAGAGATAGKLFGMAQAMKTGLGSYTVALSGSLTGVLVSALVAANPVGDILDSETGKILAGARRTASSLEFIGTTKAILAGAQLPPAEPRNTTLAVIATNARLTKVQAQQVARMSHLGFAQALSPAHTSMDGDLAIALSLGTIAAPVDAIGVAAAEAVSKSLARCARMADSRGGLPGLKTTLAQ